MMIDNIDENEIVSVYQMQFLEKMLNDVLNHKNRDIALATSNIYNNSCIQDANHLLKQDKPKKKEVSLTIARLIKTKEMLNEL